jgi:TM2 domain-containing membrane protein YozV
MTARTFGRKIMADGTEPEAATRRAGLVAGQPRSFQSRLLEPVPAPAADVEARKAAFLAEERARKDRPRDADDDGSGAHGAFVPSEPIHVREKSLTLAYLLWFLLGSTGAHRFHLGYFASGATLLILSATSWALVLAENYAAFGGVAVAGLWVIADGFLIKSLHRKAGERARKRAIEAATFA